MKPDAKHIEKFEILKMITHLEESLVRLSRGVVLDIKQNELIMKTIQNQLNGLYDLVADNYINTRFEPDRYERDYVKEHKIYKDETYETDHFVALIDEGTNMVTTSQTVVGYDPDKALTPDWVH
jgi:hypothetical protein